MEITEHILVKSEVLECIGFCLVFDRSKAFLDEDNLTKQALIRLTKDMELNWID